MTPAPRLTTDEYLKTPETVLPQELIYGVLRVADAPTPWHQEAVAAFHLALAQHTRHHVLGKVWLSPIDVILDEEQALIVQPDLVFISTARLGIVRDRIRGAPNMVLEVLSPHPRIGRLEERIGWFARYGVREAWLLHQRERRLEILTLENGRVSNTDSFDESAPIRSTVLPAFELTLEWILRD